MRKFEIYAGQALFQNAGQTVKATKYIQGKSRDLISV